MLLPFCIRKYYAIKKKRIFKSRPHFPGPLAFLKLTPKKQVIGRLPDKCSKQEFSRPPAFKKVQSRQKKVMCSQNFVLVGKGFELSIRKQFFTGFDTKKISLWLNIFYVSSGKKPFSFLYLSLLEQNLENK